MVAIRTKPDHHTYTFPGFGSEKFPNLLLRGAGDLNTWHLNVYEQQHEGYVAMKAALKMEPVAVTDEVKASGLRGRGGAGDGAVWPTGWRRPHRRRLRHGGDRNAERENAHFPRA